MRTDEAETMNRQWVLAMVGCVILPAGVASAQGPVAGTAPDRRPDGAPVIARLEHDGAWFRRALTGVERPYPWSLRFLDDQGAWHTPFNRPGMTGPYDIRGWHRERAPR